MEEATRDKQSSTGESKRNKQQQRQGGWIRMHSDQTMKSPPVEEPLDTEAQPGEREIRKEIREAIEGSERKIRKEIREAIEGSRETQSE